MSEINFYYLEKATLSNLGRIFHTADIPFIRLSKFLNSIDISEESKITSDENIGFYKRSVGRAFLGDYWKSDEIINFLKKATGFDLKFSSSQGQIYDSGDYSLLHTEEFEKERLVVVYDMTKNWNLDWGGYDIYTSPEKDPLICNRDEGTLMLTLLKEGDYSCTRYVSLNSKSSVKLDKIVYDLK